MKIWKCSDCGNNFETPSGKSFNNELHESCPIGSCGSLNVRFVYNLDEIDIYSFKLDISNYYPLKKDTSINLRENFKSNMNIKDLLLELGRLTLVLNRLKELLKKDEFRDLNDYRDCRNNIKATKYNLKKITKDIKNLQYISNSLSILTKSQDKIYNMASISLKNKIDEIISINLNDFNYYENSQ